MNIIETQNSICVVGMGPVGLAFALRLADQGKKVTLVDGGKFADVDPSTIFNGNITQASSAEDCSDTTLLESGTAYVRPNYLTNSRQIGPGGTSRKWNIRWRPGAEHRVRIVQAGLSDFDARPDLDIPGWTAAGEDVVSRYEAAMAFFGLGAHNFNIKDYSDDLKPFSLDEELFPTKLFHFAKGATIYKDRVEDARRHPNVEIYDDLQMVGFKTINGDTVSCVEFRCADGSICQITSPQFVFALGGIENVRHLLMARAAGRIADPYDNVGRWYMNHPHVRLGYIMDDDPAKLIASGAWYDFQMCRDTPILRGHEISARWAREYSLYRFSIDLVGRPVGDSTKTGYAVAQIWDTLRTKGGMQSLPWLPEIARHPMRSASLLRTAISKEVHGTAKGGWSDPARRSHGVESLSVEAMFEQRPSRDNRITLGDRLDRFGNPFPELRWSWSRRETEAANRAADLVGRELFKAGISNFVTMRDLGQREAPRAGSGFHQMGGTRQSAGPETGVVDAENRVHTVRNLTVLGTSVFPNTVGFANPTLTAVADAMRVADVFARSSVSTVPVGSDKVGMEA